MKLQLENETINLVDKICLEDMQIVKDILEDEGGEELTKDLIQLQLLTMLFKYGYYLGHDHAKKNIRI